MSKFRIAEQRGVFRIHELILERPKYKKSWIHGGMVRTGLDDLWEELVDVELYLGDISPQASGRMSDYAYEFDTYKKAENHIKKFYGLKGVDAIEKPEWQVK